MFERIFWYDESVSFKYALIMGVIFCILYKICCFFGRNKAYDRITDEIQYGEYVIYKPKFKNTWLDIGVFIVGAFGGCFLLPFWICDYNLTNIGVVNKENLPFFIIIEMISIIIILATTTMYLVLTNLRIICLTAFSPLNKFINKLGYNIIDYSNIDSIFLRENVLFPYFYIKTKDGRMRGFNFLANQKEVKEEIEKYM